MFLRALVVAVLVLAACKGAGSGGGGPGGSGGATGDGGGGGDGDGAVMKHWSCGTAAGVCTCVPVATGLGAAARPCAASTCCFARADGACTCRLPTSTLDCAALTAALGGGTRVGACGE